MQPNILFVFSDQQRYDTLNERVMPNLKKLADEGAEYRNSVTCQPVCGPARACLQTGVYASQNGSCWNGIPLNQEIKPLAEYFSEAGYSTAYVGKWHLASDRYPGKGFHCERTAVPAERRGGYRDFWRAADVLEFTSDGCGGCVFGDNGEKINFSGYRADCINDFALEFIEKRPQNKPFFLFLSFIEPHHQNDAGHYQGYKPTLGSFKDYPIPEDLTYFGRGNYREEYPDYISAINRIDYNLGRLIGKLKSEGIYENTVIVYTSDHGSHFKTRNLEYKRSCHESSIHTPLVISGGAFKGGLKVENPVSLIDLPPTLLDIAGIEIPDSYMGTSLLRSLASGKYRDYCFIQISESQVGRAIRTERFKYSVRAAKPGLICSSSKVYFEQYLYDLQNDPREVKNLINDVCCKSEKRRLRELLIAEMVRAGEKKPIILKNLFISNT